jgi:hypothetical protein
MPVARSVSRPGRVRRRAAGLALCLAVTATAAAVVTPSLASAAGQGTSYIAAFSGGAGAGSARVGIVVQDGRYKAYVCSLDENFNLQYARWYEGKVGADGAIRKTSPDGVTLKATVAGDEFTGSVTDAEKAELPFSGAAVSAGTNNVGLYRGQARVSGKPVLIGAVIDQDGTFASTTQYVGKIRFVTPVKDAPTYLGDKHLAVFLGTDEVPYIAALVTALH